MADPATTATTTTTTTATATTTTDQQQPTNNPLPTPWVERHSSSKNRAYFYNPETGQSQWERPLDADQSSKEGQIRVSHLLVKHAKSRRPSSWRTETITISLDEARDQIQTYHKQIVSGETSMASLAKEVSDCSSARLGGDLGFFGRGTMQAAFEEAAFNLQVGELTDKPVETDSGVHLILRTA